MFTLKFQGHFQKKIYMSNLIICQAAGSLGILSCGSGRSYVTHLLPGGIPDSSTGNSTIEKLHEFRALKIFGNFVGPNLGPKKGIAEFFRFQQKVEFTIFCLQKNGVFFVICLHVANLIFRWVPPAYPRIAMLGFFASPPGVFLTSDPFIPCRNRILKGGW